MSAYRHPTRWQLIGAAVFFVVVCCFRIGSATIGNDHFDRMARGQQILRFGEVPHRDFFDPGWLLTAYTSAASQAVLGHNLVGELVVTSVLMSAGFSVVFFLSWRLSRSVVIAGLASILAVSTLPRLYSYDKVFFFALALLGYWLYEHRPRRWSAMPLG